MCQNNMKLTLKMVLYHQTSIIILGKNKRAVIDMLGLRSTAQRQEIMTKYKETHKKVSVYFEQYSPMWHFRKLDAVDVEIKN